MSKIFVSDFHLKFSSQTQTQNTGSPIAWITYQASFKSIFEVIGGLHWEEGGQGYRFQTVSKDFLRDDKKLYRGNEIILYCFCVVAVKFSVESSVESLISRYECHLFCATVQILSLNLSIYVLRTYEFNRIKPILHRQLFSNSLPEKQHFPCKNPKL